MRFLSNLIMCLIGLAAFITIFRIRFSVRHIPSRRAGRVLLFALAGASVMTVASAKEAIKHFDTASELFRGVHFDSTDTVLAAEPQSEVPAAGAEDTKETYSPPAPANSAAKTDEDEDEEEEVAPEITLTDAEIDKMFGEIDPHLSWNSMNIMAYWKTEMTGFSEGVSLPLYKGVTEWMEEQLGINQETKGTLGDANAHLDDAAILTALKAQIVEWAKEMDALSEEEYAATFHERFEQEMCTNPVFADMVVGWMAEKRYFTARNAWLVEFKEELDTAYRSPEGIRYWLEYDPAFPNDPYHYQCTGHDYQKKAKKVLVFWEGWEDIGVREELSSRNYYLPAGQEADFMRTALATEQDKLPAFQLRFASKNGGYLFRVGFNIKDLRLEEFDRKTDPPKATPKETPKTQEQPKTTPKTPSSNPKTPPKETPKTPPTTTPDPTPTPTPPDGGGGKDPAEEPSHKGDGSGDKGAGDNSQPDYGTPSTPAEKQPTEDQSRAEDQKQQEEQPKQQEQIKEEVKDDNGGATHGAEPPAISTDNPDTSNAASDTVTETTTTNNGDGTTTETTETSTPSEEVSDGAITLPD